MSLRTWFVAASLLWVGLPALAQNPTNTGDYLNLSFSGDGETPTGLERLAQAAQQAPRPLAGSAAATPAGDATYAVPIALPPARLAPSVTLSYSSSRGLGRLGRGWSLEVGPSIHRPRGGELSAYEDVPGVYIVDGGGLSGILVPIPNPVGSPPSIHWFRWVSSTPGALVATFHETTGTWTVRHDDVTWTLGLRAGDYRPLVQVDGSGNRVDYTWVGSRLAEIRYGATAAVDHFLSVSFTYVAAEHAIREARGGTIDVMTSRLASVNVRSKYGRSTDATRIRYDLEYDDTDELLVGVTQTEVLPAGTDGAERLVASFEYTQHDVDGFEARADTPQRLAESSSLRPALSPAANKSWIAVVDASGDGLPDELSSLDGEWDAGWQLFDSWSPDGSWVERSWEDPDDELHDRSFDQPTPGGALDESTTVILYEDDTYAEQRRRGTYALRRFLDVDGDGFQDVLETSEAPQGWSLELIEEEDPPLSVEEQQGWFAAINEEEDRTDWTVQYGSPDGYDTAAELEDAPFRFPRISTRPDLADEPNTQWPEAISSEDATVDLMDVDGDGWLDVVQVRDGVLTYWPKLRGRGEGWALQGIEALTDQSGPANDWELLSTQHSWGDVGVEGDLTVPFDDWDLAVPTISYLEARTGFRDLNGDGAIDYVDARGFDPNDDPPTWEVWFGDGAGGFAAVPVAWPAPVGWLARSDEGSPAVTSCTTGAEQVPQQQLSMDGSVYYLWVGLTPPGEFSCSLPGYARFQGVVGGLLDMDGDGREDLVHGEAQEWFRNVGDGFEQDGRPTPGWMPVGVVTGGGTSTLLSGSWTEQTVVVAGAAIYPPGVGESSVAQSRTIQHLLVSDLDRDGLPDVVDLREAVRVAHYSGRTLDVDGNPVGYRPGLLSRVETGAGADVEIGWRSSSVEHPSGDDVQQDANTPQRKDVVAELRVADSVSGWEGRTTYDYQFGKTLAGRWLGFVHVYAQEYGTPSDRLLLNAGVDEEWLGEVRSTYDLGRDWAVLTGFGVYTDRNASWVPGRDPVEETVHQRLHVDLYHDDSGDAPVSHWLDTITALETSEARVDLTVSDSARSHVVEIEYDAVGNVVSQTHTSESRPQDTVRVDAQWVSSTNEAVWRPWQVTTSSTTLDELDDPEDLETVETGVLAYDGGGLQDPPTDGLLTQQGVCSGVVGSLCSEQLTWVFDRGSRGAVDQILAPAGRDTYFDLHDFGDAVPTVERNALSHTTDRVVDDLGRVVEEVDPNGVTGSTTYDAFGRVVQTAIQGAGATALRVVTETTWHDDEIPNWSQTVHHTWNTDGSAGPTTTSYAVYDGFGRELQSWKPADVGFVVVETESDVRGNVRWTGEPHKRTTFDNDYDATVGPTTASYAYVDIMGDPIRLFRRAESDGVEEISVDRPEPGATRHLYPEGQVREEHRDTHGRLVEVLQGSLATMTTTGSYVYDGLARVQQFTDGNGNQWKYDFDGAGRVRQVWRRGPGGGAWAAYYAFAWDGPDPIEMHEGLDVGAPVVEWTYDDLGRTTSKVVADPVFGTQTFTWTWDTPWKGARTGIVDPTGATFYTYTADPVFGGFGWPTGISRSWTGAGTVTLSHDYDAEGRSISTIWPSGALVESSYHPNGWPSESTVTPSGAGSLTVEYQYDTTYGLPSGWTASTVANTWTHEIDRIDSTKIGELSWVESAGTGDHTVVYGYDTNGWLETKRIDGLDVISYTYDSFGRISGVWNGTNDLEAYEYDAIGNPVEFHREAAAPIDWTYDPPVAFNEITHRERNGGAIADDMTYDAVTGRLLSWDTTNATPVTRDFQYDGAGRLRRIDRTTGAASRTTRLRYDADDQVVLETATTGPTATIYRSGGWRKELPSGRVTEQVLPMVRLDGGGFVIAYVEPTGNALFTDATGAGLTDSMDVFGAYGLPLYGFSAPGTTPWILDQLHGAEPDRDDEVVHFGARHMVLRDGLWMQPEPLLHLGLTNGNLTTPLGYGGLYAGGNTNRSSDRSGYALETPWDAASVSVGIGSGMTNLAIGNYGGALLDGFGVVIDLAATATPGAPAPAAALIGAYRYGPDFVSFLLVAARKGSDEVVEATTDAWKALPGSGTHRAGAEKAWQSGAEPNSMWTQTSGDGTKAVQNTIYDADGNAVGQVDFKRHGPDAPPGHGHTYPPGQPAAGHGPGATHLDPADVPEGWAAIPAGLQPAQSLDP